MKRFFGNTIMHFKDVNCTILHNTDGPSVWPPNGIKKWHIDGVQVTHAKWVQATTVTMTLAEVEAKLGKKIKIVSDQTDA